MAYSFAQDWSAEVAAVSELPEFQNAVVSLLKPSSGASYDVETGAWTGGEPDVLVAETRARIIAVGSALTDSGTRTANPADVQRIRVQFPYAIYPARVLPGTLVRVLDGGRTPALASYLFRVTSDNISSQRASHTVECESSMEAVASWS